MFVYSGDRSVRGQLHTSSPIPRQLLLLDTVQKSQERTRQDGINDEQGLK